MKKTSPVDLVTSVSNKTLITIIVGKNDKVAPPRLSIEYEKALTKTHKNVTLSVIEGGHEIFLDTKVLNPIVA